VLPSRWAAVESGKGRLAASFGVSVLISASVAVIAPVRGYVTSKHMA